VKKTTCVGYLESPLILMEIVFLVYENPLL
jgi:hypothetical protein